MLELLLIVIFLISPSLLGWSVSAEKCTLCLDGNPVPTPDNFVYDPDSGYNQTCAFHDDFVQSIFPPESSYCKYAQTGAIFLCDCKIPEDSCKLCSDESPATNESYVLDILKSEFDSASAGTPLDVNLTCGWLERNLAVYVKTGTKRCWEYQDRVSTECGCRSLPPMLESNSTDDDDETAVTVITPSSSNATCQVCENKQKMLHPEREFEFDLFNYYVDENINGFSIKNCSDLDFWVSVLPGLQSEMCTAVDMMSSYCGCQREKETKSVCTLCPNGSPPRYPLKTLNWNDKDIYNHMSFHLPVKRFNCGMFDSIIRNFDEDKMGISEGQYCLFAHLRSNYCGCDIDWKPILVIWCFRISGTLSLLGSLFVIYCVVQKKKFNSTYHQILLGLSIFDVFGSVMYILCTIMTPVEDGMFQAVGNIFTCKMQGFFIQLGLTSAFFNALLSLYFYLMICKNWTESKFRKYRMYAYAFVIVIGLILAFTGLQYYYTDMLYLYCYIRPPPAEESLLPIMLWNVAPIALVFLFMSVNTALLVYAVYKQHLASQKWNFRASQHDVGSQRKSWSQHLSLGDHSSRRGSVDHSSRRGSVGHLAPRRGSIGSLASMKSIFSKQSKRSVFRQVLWQSIYYLLSYTLTLPILMLRSLVHLTDNEYMKTSDALLMWNVIIAIFCPAQGIFNAMIFYNRENASKKTSKKESCNHCKFFFSICCCTCKKDEEDNHEKDIKKNEKIARFLETPSIGFTQANTEMTPSAVFTQVVIANKSTVGNDLEQYDHPLNDNDPENVAENDDYELGSEYEAALEFLELTNGDGEIRIFSR